MEAPVGLRGENHHAVIVGDQQLFRAIAPERFGVVEVDLDHHHAEHSRALAHRGGKEVAALAGGGAEAEEASGTTLDGFAEIRAVGEIALDEAVGAVPVGGGQGLAVGTHQVDHVGTGLLLQATEQAVGLVAQVIVVTLLQQLAQGRQLAEDRWQHLVTV